MKYYKISEAALKDLLLQANTFAALDNRGVDSWELVGDSIRDYIRDCSAMDETPYETMEDIVNADLANFEML